MNRYFYIALLFCVSSYAMDKEPRGQKRPHDGANLPKPKRARYEEDDAGARYRWDESHESSTDSWSSDSDSEATMGDLTTEPPLIRALREGKQRRQFDEVASLIWAGADVNSVGHGGSSALILALKSRLLMIADMMVVKGAQVIFDNGSETPIDLVVDLINSRPDDVIEWIELLGKMLDKMSFDDRLPSGENKFMVALICMPQDYVDQLFDEICKRDDAKAILNERNISGLSILDNVFSLDFRDSALIIKFLRAGLKPEYYMLLACEFEIRNLKNQSQSDERDKDIKDWREVLHLLAPYF